MSEIRLILTGDNTTVSGLVPSSAISTILWAVSEAKSYKLFWKKLSSVNTGAKKYFDSSTDELPILEGFDDGLLVINWDHHCIESFQSYQSIKRHEIMIPHNGLFLVDVAEPIEFTIGSSWSIADHHFEEKE